MDIKSLQNKVDVFIHKNNMVTDLPNRCLDLVSEVGEMSREYLNSIEYGKTPFNKTENWDLEIGDIFFSLICIANLTSTDLELTLTKVLEKYTERIANKT